MQRKQIPINTYCGNVFDPTMAVPEDIQVKDIARALSLICRANGHIRIFYSVAQHCLACMQEAAARGETARVQLLCLLHDAAEAYIGDLTRPLRKHLPVFSEIEDRLMTQIYTGLGIRPPEQSEQAAVSSVDDAMLYWEFRLLHPFSPEMPYGELRGSFEPTERAHEAVEAEWLAAYYRLREEC